MPDTTKTVLKLEFLNASGGTYTVTISKPNLLATSLEVDTFMAALIAANVVLTSGSALASIKDGGFVTTAFTDLVE